MQERLDLPTELTVSPDVAQVEPASAAMTPNDTLERSLYALTILTAVGQAGYRAYLLFAGGASLDSAWPVLGAFVSCAFFAVICLLARAARRTYLEARTSELEQLRLLTVLSADPQGGRRLAEEVLADHNQALSGGTVAARVYERQGRWLGTVLTVLRWRFIAREKFDLQSVLAAEADKLHVDITRWAQRCVAAGLLGSLTVIAMQVAPDASGGAVANAASGMLVAVLTTIQGVVAAGYVTWLEDRAQRALAPVCDQVAAFVHLRVQPALGDPTSLAADINAILRSFASDLKTMLSGVSKSVSEATTAAVKAALDALKGSLEASLTVAVTGALAPLIHPLSTLAESVGTLKKTIEDAEKSLNEGLSRVHTALFEPERASEELREAGARSMELAKQLDAVTRASAALCKMMGELAEKVAAALDPALHASSPPPVDGEIALQVRALNERMNQLTMALRQSLRPPPPPALPNRTP